MWLVAARVQRQKRVLWRVFVGSDYVVCLPRGLSRLDSYYLLVSAAANLRRSPMKPNVRQGGASTLAAPTGSADHPVRPGLEGPVHERWPAPCRLVATSLPPGALDLQVRVSVRVWAAVAAWPPRPGRRPPVWPGRAASVRPPTAAVLTPVEAQGRRSESRWVNCPDPAQGWRHLRTRGQRRGDQTTRPTDLTKCLTKRSSEMSESPAKTSHYGACSWRRPVAPSLLEIHRGRPPPMKGKGPAAHRRRPPMKPNARPTASTLAAPAGSTAVSGPSRPGGSGS